VEAIRDWLVGLSLLDQFDIEMDVDIVAEHHPRFERRVELQAVVAALDDRGGFGAGGDFPTDPWTRPRRSRHPEWPLW